MERSTRHPHVHPGLRLALLTLLALAALLALAIPAAASADGSARRGVADLDQLMALLRGLCGLPTHDPARPSTDTDGALYGGLPTS